MKSVFFIVNPVSGTKGKEHIVSLIPQYFTPQTWEVTILHTEHAGHAKELAQQAAAQGATAVVAIGGDGTVNEVASGLVHTQTALGIVPCGSGNGLARHLGIPMKPQKALEVLSRMDVHLCDYGLVNGHPFFCTAGVGFDAMVSDTFAHAGKRGLPTYIRTTLSVGLKYPGEKYDIEIENDGKIQVIEGKRYWLVTAGNAAQYGNDFYITPKASICDGKLDVNLWRVFSKLESPVVCSQLYLRRIDRNRHVQTLKCDRITIHRTKCGPLHWDGDPSDGPLDITMSIVKQGILMITGHPTKNKL